MTAMVDLVIRTSPKLAKELLDKGAADIITRMADGKFNAITKCVVKVLMPNSTKTYINLLRTISLAGNGPAPYVSLGVDMLKVATTIASNIKLNEMSKDVKTILSKFGEIGITLNSVKKFSYLNTGIGLVNLGTEVAGIIYIGNRLNDMQKSIEQLSTQVGHIKCILTNDKIAYFHRLCLRFGAISVRLNDNEILDRREIETLLIDMRAFISEMVRNIYYDAMDIEVILEMILNLLSAYTALLNVYIRDYYFEKGRLPENLETYSEQLFSELLDKTFLKTVGDSLILQKHVDISEVLSALQTQQLLVMNYMLQYQDNTDLVKMLETKENYNELNNVMKQYTEREMEKIIPTFEKETGNSNCREIIHRMIYENTISAC